jgi:hypothetical protein
MVRNALHIRTLVCYTFTNSRVEADHVSATMQLTYSSKSMPGTRAGGGYCTLICVDGQAALLHSSEV